MKTIASMIAAGLIAACAASPASAGHYYGHKGGYGHAKYKTVCHFERIKVRVGYDDYYEPIFKWRKKKVCKKVPYSY